MAIKFKNNLKRVNIQLTVIALSTAIFVSTAHANTIQPDDTAEYELDQVLVTAQRYQTRDVDTPASTSVYTNEELKATGGRNVLEALKQAAGLVYSSLGTGGAPISTMTSKIMIRGVASGTLVLVNGTPINLRGMYNLEDIPIENVERVEIIKGGGSVLYGSEATGGVINIITKKSLQNSFKISSGNYGQQDYSTNLQLGKLGLSYSYEKWDDTGKISQAIDTTGKEMNNFFRGLERNNNSLTYNFDDRLSLLYSHNKSEYDYSYKFGTGYAVNRVGVTRYDRTYIDNKDYVQLQYDHDHIKGTLYYNYKTLQTLGKDYYSSTGSATGYPTYTNKTDKNQTYGFDVQQDWLIKNNKALLGMAYQNEYYTPDRSKSLNYERDNYSIYGQWEQPVNAKNTIILSGRETWTGNAPNGRNYNNFSSQGQFVHKLAENENVYASVGQSFMMPTFAQMYSSNDERKVGNPNLKPQTGMHYEVGWKRNSEQHKWRIAIFNLSIKDNISSIFDKPNQTYSYTNEDMKNTGIELTCDIGGNNDWTFNWGITYGNPLTKGTEKPYWDRNYGRFQLNGGATYKHDKWKATLTGNYLADRVMTPSKAPSYAVKPYLLTSLSVNYALDSKQDIFFTANNLFDREDVISHSSSDYYYTPFNFTLGYKSKF
jgi:vitamin B12 transporter